MWGGAPQSCPPAPPGKRPGCSPQRQDTTLDSAWQLELSSRQALALSQALTESAQGASFSRSGAKPPSLLQCFIIRRHRPALYGLRALSCSGRVAGWFLLYPQSRGRRGVHPTFLGASVPLGSFLHRERDPGGWIHGEVKPRHLRQG